MDEEHDYTIGRQFGANLATGGYNDLWSNAEFYAPVGRNLYAVQSAIIKKLAQKGSCVIVGRCADYVLKDYPGCINVFICASKEDRKTVSWTSIIYQKEKQRKR